MDNKVSNHRALRDFIERYRLRNRASVVHFNALVNITTAKNKLMDLTLEVMISFDNYRSLGDITFLTGNLDPDLYPTVFKANYNEMKLMNDHLSISDIHTSNPNIGSYTVQLFPLSKVNE